MVATGRVAAIFADAGTAHESALRMLERGDIRDASEKAWCAAKRATGAFDRNGPGSAGCPLQRHGRPKLGQQ